MNMHSPDSNTAVSARPLAPWVGGKRNLAQRLVARIDAIPHHAYMEPFVGMAGVFLRRRQTAPVEGVNDLSMDVANLFRIVRHHPDALLSELRLALPSRAEFSRQLRVDPSTLTDVQRAARFLFLQRLVYGGKPGGGSFPTLPTKSRSLDATLLRRMIEALHARLARVTIECLNYQEFITRYDRPGTLFYIDPPYYGCEHYYGCGLFERGDFEKLAELLASLKGRFLMSINDTPEIRRLFARFPMEEIPTAYRIGVAAKPVVELVIYNKQ